MLNRLLALAAAGVLAAVAAGGAAASTIIDRNAAGPKLYVNGNGEALLTYAAAGKAKNVLAWGAVNALAPTKGGKQLDFKLDYAGGWGKYRRDYYKEFPRTCGAYDGPKLAWYVKACKAPDGSYWALQAWQRALPNYGLKPTATQAVYELRLSHWTGALPVLDIHMDYAYRRFAHLYGSFTYAGSGVYGFASTPTGNPLDTWGRNVYVDVLDSAYGPGWKRENSFLTHQPGGTFCYGFYSHGARPAVVGKAYRATIIGPGVTPDIMWQGPGLAPYTKDVELRDLTQQREFLKDDTACKPMGL